MTIWLDPVSANHQFIDLKAFYEFIIVCDSSQLQHQPRINNSFNVGDGTKNRKIPGE